MRRRENLILVSKSGAEISNSPDFGMLLRMKGKEPGSRIMLYSRWLKQRQEAAKKAPAAA